MKESGSKMFYSFTLQCNKQLKWIGEQGGLLAFPDKLSTSHIHAGGTGGNAPNGKFLHGIAPNRIVNLEIYITEYGFCPSKMIIVQIGFTPFGHSL